MATASVQTACPPHDVKSTTNSVSSTPQDSTPARLPHWQFPGPSSRFNQRERVSHPHKEVTRAITPSFNTERRAQHRRAHSSYTTPTIRPGHERSAERPMTSARKHSGAHARFTLPHSPPSSDSGQSPIRRFGSFTMDGTITPSRMPRSHLHDSPNSDYFIDSNSIDEVVDPSTTVTQRLLLRLNKLQSTVLHAGDDAQALYVVARRMSEIENDMESLHSQSRQPPELDDSGLFMEEEEDDLVDTNTPFGALSLDGTCDSPLDVEERKKENRRIHLASGVQSKLTQVNEALHKRYQEVQLMREELAAKNQALEKELGALRSERDLMESDHKLDQSEFFLLDSQLRLLEHKFSDDNPSRDISQAIEAMRLDCRTAIDNTRSTRKRYSDYRTDSGQAHHYDEIVKTGRWKMDVVRDVSGRVDLITMARRMSDVVEDCPHIKIEEMTATIKQQHAKPVCYADTGIQCQLLEGEATDAESDDVSLDEIEDPRAQIRQQVIDDCLSYSDCAITTSPPSEYGGSITNDVEHERNMAEEEDPQHGKGAEHERKSAWHELWDSMAELAGVGEHRF